MKTIITLSLVLGLCACGAEVAGTAASVGKLQAEQAKQAKSQQDQIKAKLDQALATGQATAASAAGQ